MLKLNPFPASVFTGNVSIYPPRQNWLLMIDEERPLGSYLHMSEAGAGTGTVNGFPFEVVIVRLGNMSPLFVS